MSQPRPTIRSPFGTSRGGTNSGDLVSTDTEQGTGRKAIPGQIAMHVCRRRIARGAGIDHENRAARAGQDQCGGQTSGQDGWVGVDINEAMRGTRKTMAKLDDGVPKVLPARVDMHSRARPTWARCAVLADLGTTLAANNPWHGLNRQLSKPDGAIGESQTNEVYECTLTIPALRTPNERLPHVPGLTNPGPTQRIGPHAPRQRGPR
jgi:hypothetical protein